MNVLLPTLGSSGDVNPFVALGVALRARGHRATVLTNPIFQAQIESQGLDFLAVGTAAQAHDAIANPDLWHPRRGFRIIAQVLIPAVEQVFRLIERHADEQTVVAFSTLSLGARVAQEKLKIPSASVHLQPSVMRTFGEQGMFGNIRLGAAHPTWLKRALFGLADALILDRNIKRPLNAFRATLGLAPVARVMHRWLHSPQLVIGFFPSWFAAPQTDWPDNMHLAGFPLWDADPTAKLDEALEFLDAGTPPIVFTPGSAGSTMQAFFSESVKAAQLAGMRAMLVTNHAEQTPANLPHGIKTFGYLPFSKLLPRSALLVYHGGIGTLAQGIKACVPHLVVPHAYDQFDNAWRLGRLGLGASIPIGAYRSRRAARTILELTGDSAAAQLRRDYAQLIDAGAAAERAADLLEQMHAARASADSSA
jgi:UDP:flavonoid glycosyltransferase YjiC (YdhE family)